MVAIQTHTHTALASELLQFTNQVDTFETPEAVLNALHEVTMPACQIAVLGALLLPLRWGDVTSIELGKTAFLHKSAPKGWWEEQLEHMQRSPGPGEMLARLALAPFTMSEDHAKARAAWGLIAGRSSLLSNMGCATACHVPSEAAGWSCTGHATFCSG